MQRIRIGVIGAGGNTRGKHIPGFQAIDGVEVVAIANRSEASARRAAEACGLAVDAYGDWRALLARDDLDAVCIGTWPDQHAACSIAALERGVHVLCEARMARDAAEAERMHACHRAHPELVAQIVPAPFTLGVDETVCALLAEGAIGRLLAIDVVKSPRTWFDPEARLSWRQDERISGHNIMALGICYESVLRWLGPARSVLAQGSEFAGTRLDAEGARRAVVIPEHLDVCARFADGVHGHFRLSAISGACADDGFRLHGSAGNLLIAGDRLWRAERGGDFQPVEIPVERRGGWRVEEEFVGAIRGREPVRLTTFADGVRYMHFTDAVWRSLEDGRAVPVA